MKPALLDRAIDWIIETAYDHAEIVFLGGEPTMVPHLIERAVHRIKGWEQHTPKRFQFNMTTNMLRLDQSLARKLADWDVPYLVSVDGYGKRHDLARPAVDKNISSPFKIIKSRMPQLRALQTHIGARVTPLPKNAQYLARDLEKLNDLGFDSFVISPATGVKWSDEALETFIEQLVRFGKGRNEINGESWPRMIGLDEPSNYSNEWGCGAGQGRYSIDPRGNIFACARFAELDAEQGLVLGNIYRGIDPQGNALKFLNTATEPRPSCTQCEERDQCLGGCPAVNLQETGSLYQPSPNECRYVKALNRVQRDISPSAIASNDDTAPKIEKRRMP
jgi:uncharacterized protein